MKRGSKHEKVHPVDILRCLNLILRKKNYLKKDKRWWTETKDSHTPLTGDTFRQKEKEGKRILPSSVHMPYFTHREFKR